MGLGSRKGLGFRASGYVGLLSGNGRRMGWTLLKLLVASSLAAVSGAAGS